MTRPRPLIRLCLTLASILLCACPPADGDATPTPSPGPPQVVLETRLGSMTIELDQARAPLTVENFLRYVEEGFYDGADGSGATIFHRVIPDFMIQGGGFTEALKLKDTHEAIVNESRGTSSNLRGTIAMARRSDPDSATSQFYINVVDNTFLDAVDGGDIGYTVFGEVTRGLRVADAIVAEPTTAQDIFKALPTTPVVITSAELR
jgi:cyclophilin family peptidyl-prolyl cis-trans isomerase